MSSHEETSADHKLHAAIVLYEHFGGTPEWSLVENTFWGLFGDYVDLRDNPDPPLGDVNQDRLVKFYDDLIAGFLWGNHGGFDYWTNVRNNLRPYIPEGHYHGVKGQIAFDEDEVQRRAYNLADQLDKAFDWDHIPPGFEYWSEVYYRLREIASGGA